MLFISHDLGVVSQVVDRIAVMYRGQVVESGSARQIFTAAAHEYTRGLLKAIPTLHSSRSQALAMVEARQYSDLPAEGSRARALGKSLDFCCHPNRRLLTVRNPIFARDAVSCRSLKEQW